MTILTAAPKDPIGYGRIVRKSPESPEVDAIVEQKALTAEQRKIGEINSGIYAFKTAPLLAHLDLLDANNANKEADTYRYGRLLRSAGERVVAIEAAEAGEVLGANTIAELVALDATLACQHGKPADGRGRDHLPSRDLRDRRRGGGCRRHGDRAVCAVAGPHTHRHGTAGSAPTTVIENCTLGNDVLVRQSCVLAESTVADGAMIGPFAHLRPGSEIGEDAHVGNFVETKKAKLGKGAKANHLTYLGDAEVGEGPTSARGPSPATTTACTST